MNRSHEKTGARRPPATAEDDRRWRYSEFGEGSRHLVLLVGGLGAPAEVPAPLRPLGYHYRIWAVSHPPVGSLSELVDGLEAFCDRHGIDRATAFGASVGGAIAQVWVRKAPERIENLILADTAPPLSKGWIRGLWTLARRPLMALPDSLIESWARRRLASAIATAGGGVDIGPAVSGLTAQHLLSTAQVLVDFHACDAFEPDDLRGWSGRLLILESDDDPMVPARYRARLRAVYPQATVHTFSRGGHLPSLRCPEDFQDVVIAFLDPTDVSRSGTGDG